jgi:multiple sugar transport system permease protein
MVRAQNRLLLFFLAPALAMILIFTILPALWAIYVSFTRMALAGPNALDMSFIGLRNYEKLFTDRDFYHSISLTLQYTLYTNIGQFVLGMAAALFLNQRKVRGQALLLAVLVMPMVIPGITQALIWSSMLGSGEFGTLNRMVGWLGIEPLNWTRSAPMLSIVLVNFWNNTGFAMILFLAGLESIPASVIESAKIDGANWWRMLLHIKLPLIRYVVMLWLLLNTIGCIGMFDLVFALTRGGPGNATELLGIYVYNQGFRYFELGLGSAAAMVMLAISLALALVYMRLMRVEL